MKSKPDSPARGPLDHGPLTGVRVLDFTWVLAGPYCTRVMADLGAEVIKVQTRSTGGVDAGNETGYFITWNRNKRSITVNMGSAEGVALAKRLVAHCDIVVENFSARVLRNWDFHYDALRAVRDDIILLSMSGMGHTGPWRDYVSFGPTLQALAGLSLAMGEPGCPPPGFGYSYADHVGGITAALAALAALEERDQSGSGQFVDLSQFEGVAALMGPALLDATANGRYAEPSGNRPQYRKVAPHGVYPCRGDDRWIAISVEGDAQWAGLRAALGDPDWAADARFADDESRFDHADELDERVAAWTVIIDRDDAMRRLWECGVPAGAVQLADDLVDRDPQLAHRGFYVAAEHPTQGETRFDGYPVAFSETPPTLRRSAPTLGQDNADVFGQLLGMSAEEVAALEEARILW